VTGLRAQATVGKVLDVGKYRNDPTKQGVMESTLFTDESLTYATKKMANNQDILAAENENGLDRAGVAAALELSLQLLEVIKRYPRRDTGVILHGLDCTLGILGRGSLDSLQTALMSDMTQACSAGLRILASVGMLATAFEVEDPNDPANDIRRRNFKGKDENGKQPIN
jgi:hypothetical protein